MNLILPQAYLSYFFMPLVLLVSVETYCSEMDSLQRRAISTFKGSPTKLKDAPGFTNTQHVDLGRSSHSNSTPHPRCKLAKRLGGFCNLENLDVGLWRQDLHNLENDDLVLWAYENRDCRADDGTPLAHVVRDFLDQEPEAKARVLSVQLIDRALLDGIGDADKGVVGLLERGFFSQKRLNLMFGHRAQDHDFGIFPYYVLYNVLLASLAEQTGMESGDAQEVLKRTLIKSQEIPESFRGELVQNDIKVLVQALKKQLGDDAWNNLCRYEQNGISSPKLGDKVPDDKAKQSQKGMRQGYKLWQLISIAKGFSFMTEEARAAIAAWLDYTP